MIREDEFSLLLAGEAADLAERYEQIRCVTSQFPMVRDYVVLPGTSSHADLRAEVFVDVADTLRRKYHIDKQAMLLIRPDATWHCAKTVGRQPNSNPTYGAG